MTLSNKPRELKRTRSDTTRVLDRTSLASPRDPAYAGGEGRVDLELPTMGASRVQDLGFGAVIKDLGLESGQGLFRVCTAV